MSGPRTKKTLLWPNIIFIRFILVGPNVQNLTCALDAHLKNILPRILLYELGIFPAVSFFITYPFVYSCLLPLLRLLFFLSFLTYPAQKAEIFRSEIVRNSTSDRYPFRNGYGSLVCSSPEQPSSPFLCKDLTFFAEEFVGG